MNDPQVDLDSRHPPVQSSSLPATIFLILFATPFAGFGLLRLVQGIRKSTAGDTKDGLSRKSDPRGVAVAVAIASASAAEANWLVQEMKRALGRQV